MNASDDETILNDVDDNSGKHSKISTNSGDGLAVGASNLSIGTRIGDYELERLLGAGAMGEVYLAKQVRLSQRCAVKVLPQALSKSVDFEKRFECEGKALAMLDHPHIVRVLNAGVDAGWHFLTMEYVDGGNLEDYLVQRGGKLPEAEVRIILTEILSGLIYAHKKNVVHRDLKPANILRTSEGHYKISDFGLALVAGETYMQSVIRESIMASQLAGYDRVTDLKSDEDLDATITANHPHSASDTKGHGDDVTSIETNLRSSRRSHRSDASALVGTIDYMSPEVRDGGAADARSDLYAVGVMAYQMLTGRKPRGGRAKEPSKLRPDLSQKWDEWVFKCLEAESNERFQNSFICLNGLSDTKSEGFSRSAKLKVQGTPPKEEKKNISPIERIQPKRGYALVIPDLNIELLGLDPDSFVMGRGGVLGLFDENKGHRVSFTSGFWLGRYPIIQSQWQAVMGNNPSYFTHGKMIRTGGIFRSKKQKIPESIRNPVERVSWIDAMEFCSKLNKRESRAKRLPEGYAYSLPTEAQWEYACRAGKRSTFSGTGKLDDMGWFGFNSDKMTHPVGQKSPNHWGFYDMHGNVWEWCYDGYLGLGLGSKTDPVGDFPSEERVLRGGSCMDYEDRCRSYSRSAQIISERQRYIGFRLALRPIQ